MPKKVTIGKTLRVTWVRSAIGFQKDQKATIRALGLHRLHETVEHRITSPARHAQQDSSFGQDRRVG